ncbi:MAG: hypothetical protein H6581_22975 [Bacteroidia bacterium]|nr:hypothetical protein [Bacteroidia bacterium]
MNSSRLQIPTVSFVLPLLLGLTHGFADCISGMIIGYLPGQVSGAETGMLILLYNALAFAGQLPAGVLLDRVKHPKIWVLASVALIAAAVAVRSASPLAAITLAGMGSALFHAGGAMVCLNAMPWKAGSPGMFAAPGVIGLILGGFLAFQGINATLPLLLGMVVLGGILLLIPFPAEKPQAPSDHGLDGHDLIMILLLLAIAMRSAIWNVFSILHAEDYNLLIWIGLAAFTGKFAGGFLADWLGWKRFALLALGGSALLLAVSESSYWTLLPGIALLQAATPVAIAAMHRLMPRAPATAGGLTLGLAIAAGGLPYYLGLSASSIGNVAISMALGAAALLYWLVLRRLKSQAR